MIDIVETSSQGLIFLQVFIFGFVSGFFLIIDRAAVKRLKNRLAIFIVDFFTGIAISAIYILSDILAELGQFHIYTVLAFLLGTALFMKFNSMLKPYSDRILNPVRKFFSKPYNYIMKIIKK